MNHPGWTDCRYLGRYRTHLRKLHTTRLVTTLSSFSFFGTPNIATHPLYTFPLLNARKVFSSLSSTTPTHPTSPPSRRELAERTHHHACPQTPLQLQRVQKCSPTHYRRLHILQRPLLRQAPHARIARLQRLGRLQEGVSCPKRG